MARGPCLLAPRPAPTPARAQTGPDPDPDPTCDCDLRGGGHAMAVGSSCIDDHASDLDDLVGVTLARGKLVHRCLQMGERIVSDTPTAHVAAFRHLFGSSADIIFKVWRALLPGLAQLWFRASWHFQRFPYRLILLVAPKVPQKVRQAVARELITAPDCCLDVGMSRILRDVARLHAPGQLEQQIAFLQSTYIFTIVLAWTTSVSACIFDLECMNSLIRSFRQGGGRPPDFATTAAKASLHDFELMFRLRWGRNPRDHMSDAMSAMRAAAATPAASSRRGPQKGHLTAYTEFSRYKHQEKRHTSLCHSLKDALLMDKELKQQIGRDWKELTWEERQHWESKAEACGVWPWTPWTQLLATSASSWPLYSGDKETADRHSDIIYTDSLPTAQWTGDGGGPCPCRVVHCPVVSGPTCDK